MALNARELTLEELLYCGVHFGHKSARWNPKMKPYIHKVHHGVHIIDLRQTLLMLHKAMAALQHCVRTGGRVLFVGTKLQARAAIKEAATRCGQYYVNHRWLGGTLTNWKTISASLKHFRDTEEKVLSPDFASYTKKEQLVCRRSLEGYEANLGGIRNMGGLPDMLFVIDANKESIAVQEARKLGIPIIAIVDTNTDPTLIDYPIPGNDYASRAIQLYTTVVVEAVLSGLQEEFAKDQTPEKIPAPRTTRKKPPATP